MNNNLFSVNHSVDSGGVGHEKCTFHNDLELDHRPSTREDLISDMANSYRLLLSSLGENPNRQVTRAMTGHRSIDSSNFSF